MREGRVLRCGDETGGGGGSKEEMRLRAPLAHDDADARHVGLAAGRRAGAGGGSADTDAAAAGAL